MRLLHMWAQEDLWTGPLLDQQEASGVARILQHGDARAIWLDRLNLGDEIADRALGRAHMIRKRAIADEYNDSTHAYPEKVGVAPNAVFSGGPAAENWLKRTASWPVCRNTLLDSACDRLNERNH